MKFRKKPVVIEAEQWFRDINIDGVKYNKNKAYNLDYGVHFAEIKTLEGWHTVTEGDWIITGVKGEKYPCKPDIFEMTYEKVND